MRADFHFSRGISNLDPRVIQFCWALPRELRTSPGSRKPLLLAALKDDLPAPILNRKYKANFNEPYWRGLNQNLPALARLADQFSHVYGGALFDPAILKDCLNQHAVGIGDIASGSHLARELSLLACGF
ncbi:MAG: asparagine synthase-related protein [Cyanobacteriota bacterium]|jgi:asparagine synthase (glutamine-hydrolysing)